MQKSFLKVKQIDFNHKTVIVEKLGEIAFDEGIEVKGVPLSFHGNAAEKKFSLKPLRGVLKDKVSKVSYEAVKDLRMENERRA